MKVAIKTDLSDMAGDHGALGQEPAQANSGGTG